MDALAIIVLIRIPSYASPVDQPTSKQTLDEWLTALCAPDEFAWTWAFPNDELRDSYLDSISSRSDGEVRGLLRHFLVPSGSLGADESRLEFLDYLAENDADRYDAVMSKESSRRLVESEESGEGSWEGTTWVLDLLPRWPMRAIEVLGELPTRARPDAS